MSENAEEWLATEDPTNGELPTTEFIGSAKDQSQTLEPTEGDGEELPDEPLEDDTEDDESEGDDPETPDDDEEADA